MAEADDKFSRRYERKQEQKRAQRDVVSPDDAPLPDVPVERARADESVGRNDPCPCGSGKKYKKCCGKPS